MIMADTEFSGCPPILIDITRLIFRLLKGKRPTGVDRVGLAYIRHYRSKPNGLRAVLSWHNRICVLDADQSAQVFDNLLNNGANVGKTYWHGLLGKLIWQGKPSAAFSGCLLFNTGHKGTESPDYVSALQKMGVRPVYFVHDLIPLTHPEYCRPEEESKHAQRMANILQSSAAIIVNSEDTQRALSTFAHENRLPEKPIHSAWLASGIEHTATQNLQPEKWRNQNYFVALGTIEARKNHLLLLHIWRQMLEQPHSDSLPHLLIIGQRGWECEQVADLLERCKKIQPYVHELNGINDAELTALLAHARALLFPSFTEGFGMPLVEALEAGLPVIAADIAVFREIGQGIPDFADPVDGKLWAQLIHAYTATDSPLRQSQIQRMQQYRPWTWQDHFQSVDAFLQQQGLL